MQSLAVKGPKDTGALNTLHAASTSLWELELSPVPWRQPNAGTTAGF
jgi:hypothetical protein